AYIAISYVLANNFDYALVQNAAGKYPTPGVASISAAGHSVTSVPSDLTRGISITNPPASAADAHPISTLTYAIVPKSLSSSGAEPMKKFINWAVTTGQQYGPKLEFAPLPQKVVSAAQADVKKIG